MLHTSQNRLGFRKRTTAPLFKLTAGLLATYQHINQTVFTASLPNEGYDDENGNYIVRRGDLINDRYEIRDILGRGSFGQVVQALDRLKNELVAVKIIKNKTPFTQQAQTEIRLLEHINRMDINDQYCIVRLLDHFVFRRHVCLVFEHLSVNLFDLLRQYNFYGFSLGLVRKFAYQLLTSLLFLSHPDVRIIHCDIKPENVLLRNPKRSAIKLIDFGSSCYSGERMYKYIQSRFYRSPEVLLELEYNQGIDMWSLGCLLVELHTGEPLFNGQNEVEQIGKQCEVLGLPPLEMVLASPKAKKFFSFQGALPPLPAVPPLLDWDAPPPPLPPVKFRPKAKSFTPRDLRTILGVDTGGPDGRRREEPGHSPADYQQFLDLLQQLLVWDPSKRLSPSAALQHPFFRPVFDAAAAAAAAATSGPPQPVTQPTRPAGGPTSMSTTPVAVAPSPKPVMGPPPPVLHAADPSAPLATIRGTIAASAASSTSPAVTAVAGSVRAATAAVSASHRRAGKGAGQPPSPKPMEVSRSPPMPAAAALAAATTARNAMLADTGLHVYASSGEASGGQPTYSGAAYAAMHYRTADPAASSASAHQFQPPLPKYHAPHGKLAPRHYHPSAAAPTLPRYYHPAAPLPPAGDSKPGDLPSYLSHFAHNVPQDLSFSYPPVSVPTASSSFLSSSGGYAVYMNSNVHLPPIAPPPSASPAGNPATPATGHHHHHRGAVS